MSIKKLSLIIPIYGVESYIGQLLESLKINLSYGIEVVLVDDGSKDNCGLIIDEFQKQNPNYVKVVHKANGGVGSARNAGLSVATGEYISFIDGDDFIFFEYVNDILVSLEKYNRPDVLFFDCYYYDGENQRIKSYSEFLEGAVDKKYFVEVYLNQDNDIGVLWNKVIKKDCLKEVRFDENLHFGEDTLFLGDVLLRTNTLAYLKKPLYYYRENRVGSLCTTKKLGDVEKFFERIKGKTIEYKNIYGIKAVGRAATLAYFILRQYYIGKKLPPPIKTSYYEQFIKDNIRTIMFNNGIKMSVKRQCLFVWIGVAKWYNRRKYKK